MIRIVLCEGETDQILLGLYLSRMCGWTFQKKSKLNLRIPETFPIGNRKAEAYSKGTEELVICCVGGKDSFGQFFREYILRIIEGSSDKEKDFRIALVTDADNRKISDIQTDIATQLAPHICDIKNNTWQHNTIPNSFNTEANIEFLLTVIPQKGSGALETVLMDSLAEMDDGDTIVNCSTSFVDSLPPNEYIPTERLKLKAKLGVALSIIYPDKVFSQFDQQLKIVDWGDSTTLADCFSELMRI